MSLNVAAWIDGDVDGMVADIRADYAQNHAPYSYDTLSVSDHARIMGFRWLHAHITQPHTTRTGRPDHAQTRRMCDAVIAAVDRVIDERMAEIDARLAAGKPIAPVAYSDEVGVQVDQLQNPERRGEFGVCS